MVVLRSLHVEPGQYWERTERCLDGAGHCSWLILQLWQHLD